MRTILSALILFFSTIISAATLHQVVVFGDSLSDNGNLYEYMKHQFPVSPPYFKGRMTNGPVWAELLVQSSFPESGKNHLLDYAFAGAAAIEGDDEPLFTLHSEMDSYFLAHHDKADEDTLYVLWIGANNYLALPDNLEQVVRDVNDCIKHGLQRLVDKGAKHILVLNLPDLGRIPLARDLDEVPKLTLLTNRHNDLLRENVEAFKTAYPAVQWLHLDIRSELDEMLSNPEKNGFTNVTGTCYESSLDEPSIRSALTVAANIKVGARQKACDGFLFFDLVHPSALAHQILADRMRVLLQDSGIDFAESN